MTSTATVDAARYLPPFAPSARDRIGAAIERERASRELSRLLERVYGLPPRREPSAFGLTSDELRKHANALARSGWTVPEVRERLAVPAPERGPK